MGKMCPHSPSLLSAFAHPSRHSQPHTLTRSRPAPEREARPGPRPGTTCTEKSDWYHCTLAVRVRDYRTGRWISRAQASDQYDLPVEMYYPKGADGPVGVLLYGHGLSSDTGEADYVASRLTGIDYAILASPAPKHGNHPSREDPDDVAALNYLGIDLSVLKIDALTMRGHFNQTNMERLQLLELVRSSTHLPGNPSFLIDPDLTVYFGVSLGGILGTGLLALDNALSGAVLSVAGGELIKFATDTPAVDPFRPALINIFGSTAQFERILPVAQTLVDAADPVTLAASALHDRRIGPSHTPNVLLPVAVYDDVVPPSTGRALARALKLPHIEPVSVPVSGLLEAAAPAIGNGPGGTSTLGYFQFDRVPGGNGVVAADHINTPTSDLALQQLRVFLESIKAGGPAVIINPYDGQNVPPLP